MRSLSDAPVSNALLAAAALLLIAARSGTAAPVLMISVDGMRPEYVLEAAQRGVKVPYLKSLMSDGSYAQGVTGVWPTVTYPSHTTLVTGVSPAEHGIFSNLEFDPGQTFKASWYWYAGQIRVPTLWSAVHSAHLSTASVGWPVTVGATDIDYLIPEYWRLTAPTEDLNPSDRHMIAAVSRPVDLLARMQRSLGPYLMGNDTSVQGDETKSRFLIDILRKYRPAFTTLHLSSLDVTEHTHGAFSAQAIEDMEAIDRMLADISAAARANIPDVAADPPGESVHSVFAGGADHASSRSELPAGENRLLEGATLVGRRDGGSHAA
jgi:predicted AlkP superfamily pyrophosphatase or phosphodiesterase